MALRRSLRQVAFHAGGLPFTKPALVAVKRFQPGISARHTRRLLEAERLRG